MDGVKQPHPFTFYARTLGRTMEEDRPYLLDEIAATALYLILAGRD